MIRTGDTSAASAARFHAARPLRVSNRESAACLDEVVLRYVGYFPRRAAAIFADVRDDYGSVDERRLWARMKSLRARGFIERTPDGFRQSRARASSGVSPPT